MAVRTIDELKQLFETGDTPSESNYIDLLDTLESISNLVNQSSGSGTSGITVGVNGGSEFSITSQSYNWIRVGNIVNFQIALFGISGSTVTVGDFTINFSGTDMPNLFVSNIQDAFFNIANGVEDSNFTATHATSSDYGSNILMFADIRDQENNFTFNKIQKSEILTFVDDDLTISGTYRCIN